MPYGRYIFGDPRPLTLWCELLVLNCRNWKRYDFTGEEQGPKNSGIQAVFAVKKVDHSLVWRIVWLPKLSS